MIERFNRTIKEKMFKYFSANNSFINEMTSKEASRKENEKKVWRNLYPEFDGMTLTSKFSIVIMLE